MQKLTNVSSFHFIAASSAAGSELKINFLISLGRIFSVPKDKMGDNHVNYFISFIHSIVKDEPHWCM
jgi:hypothetical protein